MIPEVPSDGMTAQSSGEGGSSAGHSGHPFERLAEPYRRELRLHCYRMLGSVHEAEDLVQETYLRAWRSFESFDGSGSFRAWLYRIATNACLSAIAGRRSAKRLLPDQYAPASAQMPDGKPASEVAWLEPFPDSSLEGISDEAPNPEARHVMREAVQLAFIAAIQQLPPRQRAVLLLCDVLGWSAAEAAELLDGSPASINSALQRARATLSRLYSGAPPAVAPAPTPAEQALLGRYLRAWETLDLNGLAALLKEDAIYTMPPLPQWYSGREAIQGFFGWAWRFYDGFRLIPTAANAQPAFAGYARKGTNAQWTAHSIHLLQVEADRISRLTMFVRPGAPDLFRAFGLPLILPETVEFEASRSSMSEDRGEARGDSLYRGENQ
ncbi:MAG TPA: sigma-70 family RNA polymerase sigma factor [Steroidobacteraceae bacterium]|nr:sigma-70 family RNA polymerase sigma factor [Steroidobacteraceae bacterium]